MSRKVKDQYKNIFDTFANESGKINPQEVVDGLKALGLDQDKPAIFDIFKGLNTPENAKKGVDYDSFVKTIKDTFGKDKNSAANLKKKFQLYLNDPNDDTINFANIKSFAQEVGGKDIKKMIDSIGSSMPSLNFDEFSKVMKGQKL